MAKKAIFEFAASRKILKTPLVKETIE